AGSGLQRFAGALHPDVPRDVRRVPHRYLLRRRVERGMYLLRATDRSVTDICLDVGFTSLGTFSRIFRDIVGATPSAYRERGPIKPVPNCFAMAWTRPSSFGEAPAQNIV